MARSFDLIWSLFFLNNVLMFGLHRYGVPLASLYTTHQYDLWKVAVRSPEAEQRLQQQINQVQHMRQMTSAQVRPYWSSIDRIKVPNVKQSWNCAVKFLFRKLNTMNASSLANDIAIKWKSVSNSLQMQTKYNWMIIMYNYVSVFNVNFCWC